MNLKASKIIVNNVASLKIVILCSRKDGKYIHGITEKKKNGHRAYDMTVNIDGGTRPLGFMFLVEVYCNSVWNSLDEIGRVLDTIVS